jgi:hypothetical protein
MKSIVLAVVFGVCLVAPTAVLPAGADATASASRLDFYDCTTQFGAFPVPKPLLAQMVPAEFQTTPFSVTPGTTVASVPVYVQQCARAESDTGTEFPAPREAWLAIWVAPPPAWRLGPGAAHYWLVQRATTDPLLDAVYEGWGLGPSTDAVVSMERVDTGAGAWVDVAVLDGPGLGLRMVNTNVPEPTPWAGLQARYFARGADGAIHAVDHREAGGFISQIQPSVAIPTDGAAPLLPVNVGLGRTFTGTPSEKTWSFTRVNLPALG